MRTCYGEHEQHRVGVCLPSPNGPLIYRAVSLHRLSADKPAAVEEGRKGKTGADRPGSPLAATQPFPLWLSQNQSQPGRHILPDNKSKLTSSFPLNG